MLGKNCTIKPWDQTFNQELKPPVFVGSDKNGTADGIPQASSDLSPFAGMGAVRFFAFILNS